MIYSTLTKFAGLGVLFSVIAVSGYILTADKGLESSVEQHIETDSAQLATETIIESDDELDSPVVKLASLSVMTDYPMTENSDINAEIGIIAEERMTSAKQLAGEQKFDEALRMLDIKPTNDQEKYSLNYLKAQILSWSGDHSKAKVAFTKLREQYPQDADIAVSFGYLHLYQNNFKDAERLFSQVLARFPDYNDARQGLKRATAIQ